MDDIDSRPIVVGVDGSPASRAALAWAAEEAERRGCAVEAVTGTHRDFGFAVGAVPVDVMIGMLPEEMRAAQQEVLDAAVAAVSTTVEIRTSPVKEEASWLSSRRRSTPRCSWWADAGWARSCRPCSAP